MDSELPSYIRDQVETGFNQNRDYMLKIIESGDFSRLKEEMEDIQQSTNNIFEEIEMALDELDEEDEEDVYEANEDDEDELDEEDKTEDE